MSGTWADLCQLTTLRKGTKGSRWQVLLPEWERVQGKTWKKVGNGKIGVLPDSGASPPAPPAGPIRRWGGGRFQEGNCLAKSFLLSPVPRVPLGRAASNGLLQVHPRRAREVC